MPTSFFFKNNTYQNEQRLWQNLADEMIKIFGVDCYYVIRNTNSSNIDKLFDEAPTSSFTTAIPMEMYINTYEGFQGEGDLLTKFGLSIADKLVLSVSRRRFAEDIGSIYGLVRAREGDLVYFPFSNGLFEIKFVEHEASFYQNGSLQYYELQLEKFNYNSEVFNTGIPAIDAVQHNYSTADDNFYYLLETGDHFITQDGYDLVQENDTLDNIDPINQNVEFETLANTFIDFSITNPFSEDGEY